PWLIELEHVTPEQQPLVGTKAVHLAQMQALGYQVPAGVCLTTAAFEHGYCKPESSEASSRISTELREQVLVAFESLQQRYPSSRFAVRSSSLEEDGQQASWAGMFLSSLNIRSKVELLDAVERGFDSLYSTEACLFRQQQTPGNDSEPAMALIVQRQIEPSASGIVFTRDPLASTEQDAQQRLCINAVRGLAEPLASGEIDGDLYWLDRQNRLLEHRLAPPEFDQPVQPPVLNRQQLRKLALKARQLEQRFGFPLDIEFALEANQLWLLQARAIVNAPANAKLSQPARQLIKQEQRRLAQLLRQLQQQQTLRCGPGILSNSNIAELLPSPTPMSFAVFNQIFAGRGGAIPNGRRALGYRTSPDTTEQLFELVAGQPYFHLELDARCYEHSHPLPVADYLAQVRNDPAQANYPEFGLYQQFITAAQSRQRFGAEHGLQRYRASHKFHHTMTLHGQRYLRHYLGWGDNYLDTNLQQQRTIDLTALNAPQLIIQINRWLLHLRQISCCHFVMAARLGFFFAESLRFQLQQHLGDETEQWMSQLLQALPGSRINQQSFDLQRLQAQQLSAQQYLECYGHLASNELELSLPRYDENPELLDSLLNAPQHPPAAEPQTRQQFDQQLRQRKRQERELSARLHALGLSSQQQHQIWSDLRLARRFLPLRETIKYHYAGEYALIRKALLQLAQRLRLGAEQIFYLQPDELPLCLKELPALRKLIEQRQQQRQLCLEIAGQQPLPAVIFGDRIELSTSSTPPDSNGDSHSGQPMAPGYIRGKVRLIDPHQSDLHQLMACVSQQDIIVTRSANLGLAPLMRKVAGLIVEVGGLLAHSACQAREAGIPAMVLPNATQLLKEGGQISFDGQTGILHIN
ncbi:MAG: PEP/pyruvate-binding domain-containing protein, partial [Halopseudomonas sp.]